MNEEHARIVAELEGAPLPVKMGWKSLVTVIAIPIALGILGAVTDIRDTVDIAVLGGIVGILLLLVMWFVTQRIDLTGRGIRVSGWFRKTREFRWEEITWVNYGRALRWMKLKGARGTIYFNSTEGLENFGELVLIAAFRTGYKCPPKVRAEAEQLLDSIVADKKNQ